MWWALFISEMSPKGSALPLPRTKSEKTYVLHYSIMTLLFKFFLIRELRFLT